MAETKFTKGPWKAYRFSAHDFTATPENIAEHPNYWEVASEDGKLSVTAHMGRANAHLIAAAPELYEALNSIVNHDEVNGDRYVLAVAYDMAHAALRKARGEA